VVCVHDLIPLIPSTKHELDCTSFLATFVNENAKNLLFNLYTLKGFEPSFAFLGYTYIA
jgi:hypothetical protein